MATEGGCRLLARNPLRATKRLGSPVRVHRRVRQRLPFVRHRRAGPEDHYQRNNAPDPQRIVPVEIPRTPGDAPAKKSDPAQMAPSPSPGQPDQDSKDRRNERHQIHRSLDHPKLRPMRTTRTEPEMPCRDRTRELAGLLRRSADNTPGISVKI